MVQSQGGEPIGRAREQGFAADYEPAGTQPT
jgi:hypothetical protein